MALTDTTIKKAQPTDKLQKLSDGAGLQLHIVTTGGKLWRWAYRFDGKQKTFPLGSYPAVSLAKARELHREGVKLLASGVDPMAKKKSDKTAKAAAHENNFESVAREWWEHWKAGRTSDHHVDQTLRRLVADVFPQIGTRPVAEIEAPELVALAKEIEKRGAAELGVWAAEEKPLKNRRFQGCLTPCLHRNSAT